MLNIITFLNLTKFYIIIVYNKNNELQDFIYNLILLLIIILVIIYLLKDKITRVF